MSEQKDWNAIHADLRERHHIVMAYWQPRGLKPDHRGNMYISHEMEAEALADHAKNEKPKPKETRKLTPNINTPPIDLVEPGAGELRVAILCPGPSLRETWPEGGRLDGFDLVLAVNNAAEWAPCEWWVSNDAHPLKTYQGKPSVGICTNGANAETLTGDRSYLPPAVTHEDLDALKVVASHRLTHEKAPRIAGWSTCSAIILAARLGARYVALYGDDKQGNAYHDGLINKGSKPSRWERETKNQSTLVRTLGASGVEVVNIRSDQPKADS